MCGGGEGGGRAGARYTLDGASSAARARGYLDYLPDVGRFAHEDVKSALSRRAASLGFDSAMNRSPVIADAPVESNESPRKAHPMRLDTVRAPGELAADAVAAP